MKNKIVLAIFLGIFSMPAVFSQWPGYFYAFELKDKEGNIIDTNSTDFKMTPISATENLITGISICEGNKMWHFYAGGNLDLDKTNTLKIEKIKNAETTETMIIEFPASLSGGKEKFYRDLYIGTITFKKGTYKVKLPETGNQWDNLKEKKGVCPLDYAISTYYDISNFQK